MKDTQVDGNHDERGLRGDPGADRTSGDGTRDQKCLRCSELEAELSRLQPYIQHLPRCEVISGAEVAHPLNPLMRVWMRPGTPCTCGLLPPQTPR